MIAGRIAPYRVLFPASFLCALFTVALWPLGGWYLGFGPAFEPEIVWHVHELLFGFTGAAIGGYLLTALPAWTNRPPVQGGALITLLALWAIARIGMALADFVPPGLLVIVNAGYFVLLAGIVGLQLISSGNYQKLVYLGAVVGLGVTEFLFLSATLAGAPPKSLELVDILLIGLAMLMISVGIRAIPAFTSNWLALDGFDATLVPSTWQRTTPQALLGLALVARLIGWLDLAYIAMIFAAMAVLWTMRRWRTLAIIRNPLLVALHLAFFWVPFGLIAMGATGLAPSLYPMADALHAITIGGMAGMIMAIAGRAAAHTTEGDLKANWGFILGIIMIWIATCTRIVAPVFSGHPLVVCAAVLWCLGWIAFLVGFVPALSGPLRRPVLSGRRHQAPVSTTHIERAGG